MRNKEQTVIENNVVRFKTLNYLGSRAMQQMLINVDYKSLLQTDKCVYTGNMNSCSSTEELRFVTTYQTSGKFRFYYSAGM